MFYLWIFYEIYFIFLYNLWDVSKVTIYFGEIRDILKKCYIGAKCGTSYYCINSSIYKGAIALHDLSFTFLFPPWTYIVYECVRIIKLGS